MRRELRGPGALAGGNRVPGRVAAMIVVVALSGMVAATTPAAAVAMARSTKTPSTSPGGSVLHRAASASTVWLCRPGLIDDPCTSSLAATVIPASGATSVVKASDATSSAFDCFYVYPTVSQELSTNADLTVQKTEIAAAVAQASRFSRVCRVFAPMYRQVTLAGLAAYPNLEVPAADEAIAYDSLASGFEDYLVHYNDGRPIVFIGHSQGAALLIALLSRLVDSEVALRDRLVLAVIPGGDVEVRTGSLMGGSFSHIPVCSRSGESSCVIAYSSFPGEPPTSSLFGRPGQGVALQSGQTAKTGLEVACVNPASISGGTGDLDPYFPSEGSESTPWVEFPGLYSARCETRGGATWLQVAKATGASDPRPVVTEKDGPDWGYHTDDVNLALGNLVADVASAESSWATARR